MSNASTPLLPSKSRGEHPIFSRVCHSPWVSITQKSLVLLRGLVMVYSIVGLIFMLYFEGKYLFHGWLIPFEFGNIVWVLQTIYAIIAFIWCFMHLYYPTGSNRNNDTSSPGAIQKFFSPPKQNKRIHNRGFFSIFYTAANTFPFVSTFVYRAILVPQHKSVIPGDQSFKHGWTTGLYLLHKYGINVLIAIIEIFFLSSIVRQRPVWAHINGLAILSLLYIGWAYIGYAILGKFTYYFIDHRLVGWEYWITSVVVFVALGAAFFFVVYGLTGLREACCNKCEKKAYSSRSNRDED